MLSKLWRHLNEWGIVSISLIGSSVYGIQVNDQSAQNWALGYAIYALIAIHARRNRVLRHRREA